MSVLLLAATTAATTSAQFCVNKRVTKTISATGLAGAEYVDVQLKDSAGNWVTTSTANRLLATDPARGITTEGDYRLSKSATAGAVSLHVSS